MMTLAATFSVVGVLQGAGLALVLALPGTTQPAPVQQKPDLRPSLLPPGPPPVPTDKDGNPIRVQEPTEAEQEAARQAEAQRAEDRLAQEERQRAEDARNAEHQLAAQVLAEEKEFHNRIMKAVYAGLAMVAIFMVSRFFKRSMADRER